MVYYCPDCFAALFRFQLSVRMENAQNGEGRAKLCVRGTNRQRAPRQKEPRRFEVFFSGRSLIVHFSGVSLASILFTDDKYFIRDGANLIQKRGCSVGVAMSQI